MPEQTDASRIYLPALFHRYPWISPFGVESKYTMTWPLLMTKAVDLRANWVRLNQRISWRDLQPAEGAAIDWSQLADFEDELRALKANGMTPMVIVDNHPEWATIEAYGADGQRSWCAAIRPDKYNAFAQFMRELVTRYKVDEFDVHYWELGNEPDVDPALVKGSSNFGCWGDIDDPYYGGEVYGEMLKVVTPAIRSEDPRARLMVGGLLLDRPLTTDPNLGRPELFLEGILRAGGGDYFDILAFHAYPSYD
ncbi:MAG: cellulase family glycosylhydrolase, partial [Anaerolineae bacterium]